MAPNLVAFTRADCGAGGLRSFDHLHLQPQSGTVYCMCAVNTTPYPASRVGRASQLRNKANEIKVRLPHAQSTHWANRLTPRTGMSTTTRANLLGSLITAWTPPATCSTLGIASNEFNQAYQAQQCLSETTVLGQVISTVNPSGVSDDLTCWPPTATAVPYPSIPLLGWGFYSPGLSCPHGRVSACSSTEDITGDGFPFQFPLTSGETAVGCCPS